MCTRYTNLHINSIKLVESWHLVIEIVNNSHNWANKNVANKNMSLQFISNQSNLFFRDEIIFSQNVIIILLKSKDTL